MTLTRPQVVHPGALIVPCIAHHEVGHLSQNRFPLLERLRSREFPVFHLGKPHGMWLLPYQKRVDFTGCGTATWVTHLTEARALVALVLSPFDR